MLEPIHDLPSNVLGFRAEGEVTGADYETTLIPAIEEILARHKSVRFLYHLGDEFSGFDAKALWDDAKVGLEHFSAWERVAVVTDVVWVHMAVTAFRFVMPGQVRVYSNSQLQDAKLWLSE